MSVVLRARAVRERIAAAAVRSGRDASAVQLVAVSKKQPLPRVQEFIAGCAADGIPAILGENYVQEFKQKQTLLTGNVQAHLIGPLQRNKTKEAVRLFDVIESVHSPAILAAIDTAAQQQAKRQEILLQVNISEDPAKSGVAPRDVQRVIEEEVSRLTHVQVLGFMTITEHYDHPEEARRDFRKLRVLRDELITRFPRLEAQALSMGMSSDFEIAIEEGATIVRVGSAVFGEREVA